MCIAILKPKDKTLSDEVLKTCAEANKDGCGFAFVDNNNVIHINKYLNFDEFLKAYREVEHESNMLIHFRIATHGKVTADNCHPFLVNEHLALIHNGTISGYGDKEKKVDTLDFIDKVLSKISWKMIKNPAFRQLLGDAIGYSKFCLLDNDGNYYIVNEHRGEWVDGVWYSNSSWKPKVYTQVGNTKQLGFANWDCYGSESYDDWYEKYQKEKTKKEKVSSKDIIEEDVDDIEYDLIYECEKCKKKFYSKQYIESCPNCKSDKIVEIGYRDKATLDEYLYEDLYENV